MNFRKTVNQFPKTSRCQRDSRVVVVARCPAGWGFTFTAKPTLPEAALYHFGATNGWLPFLHTAQPALYAHHN